MQADMLSENAKTEQIPMLEVTKTGEVDFENQHENSEENLPPITEKSEVRNHLISFKVNDDDELETINRRYAETSFKSRIDFCRYSALTNDDFMSKIGYIRVFMEHQETARQQEIMCGYKADRIFSEKISGENKDRPQLKTMLARCRFLKCSCFTLRV